MTKRLNEHSEFITPKVPFTQIPNTVIVGIKDNDAFRIYSFLCSKPGNWKVIKEWTANQCGIGEKKARQCWGYLARCGLIRYVETRNVKGKIIKHDMEILGGDEFDKDELFINTDRRAKPIQAKSAPVDETHIGKKQLSGLSTCVDLAPLYNKDLSNKDEKQKQRESAAPFSTIPISFIPDDQDELLAAQLHLDVRQEKDAFVDYYNGLGEKRNCWHSTFRSWMRKSPEFKKKYGVKEHPVTAAIRAVKEDYKSQEFMNLLN